MVGDDVAVGCADFHTAGADLDALANETRRAVLRHLLAREERVTTLQELASVVVERDGGVDDPTRARVRLHHCDLPKLDEIGAIDYDPRSEAVRVHGRDALAARLGNDGAGG